MCFSSSAVQAVVYTVVSFTDLRWHATAFVTTLCVYNTGACSGETFDTEALHRMLNELFHEDHGHANQHLWAVVSTLCSTLLASSSSATACDAPLV